MRMVFFLLAVAAASAALAPQLADAFMANAALNGMILAVLVCIVPGFVSGDWQTWFYRSLVLLVIAASAPG